MSVLPSTERLRLELKRARVPALQYLFLIACAAFAASIIFKNQFYERPWVGKREYKVAFDDVKGVTPGVQRVKIAGVTVGVVSASKVGPGNRPVLTLSIEKKYGHLYRDARMRLRPLTPLQDMYVLIESRGHPRAGELKGTLSAQRTESPVDISRVLNTFDLTTRQRLQGLLVQMDRGLTDNGEQLNRAFAEIAPFLKTAQRTTGALQQRRVQLARLMTNMAGLTTALAQRDRQLQALVHDGNASLKTIASKQAAFSATVAEIPPTLATIRSSFASLRAAETQLDPALRSLGPVAKKLEPGLSGLEDFARQAQPALRSLSPAFRQLRPLADDLRPTARSLATSFAGLRPQAPQFDRITAMAVPCLDKGQKFFTQTLSVIKFYDAYGAWPRGENTSDGDTALGQGQTMNTKRMPSCVGSGK